ncbi:MAG: RagB/SusD family nutrient uptake outer membrane protein [Dysgonamonadaceae bacterium]|jgi:hypothetical protein|nr:RagB/SusD family nutrient uptake outer membrane protein [Dysgonamonadaceae bacterium]
MKQIYKTGIGLLAALLMFGCDDFLKHDPYARTSDSFWKTEDDVKSALNAFYEYIHYEGVCGRGIFYYENCSDDMFTGRPQAPSDSYTCENFTMGAVNNLDVNDTWPVMYQMINKANNVLRYVPGMNIPETLKTNALAQARFFRAYAYLWLAPWYGDNGDNGGIPIVTEETMMDDIDVPRPPTILDNYNMIIADMREAAESLPLLSQMAESDYGRPYKTAAWAFAARAALYAAQYQDNSKAAEKHSSLDYHNMVIEFCDNIIRLTGSDKRELHYAPAGSDRSNFADLFRWENNFSQEYIYSILGNETAGPKFHGMFFHAGGWGYYNTWGYFMPTLDLYNAYESEGDVQRREATILAPGEHIRFIGHDIQWCVNPKEMYSESAMTNRKFMSVFEDADCVGKYVNVSGNNQSNRLSVHTMRYADVLLMKAEALIWSKGEGNAEAKALINQVRKRAGLSENSAATKDALKKERRLELAFEFFPSRHLDLLRWGDAQAAYSRPTEGWQVNVDDAGQITKTVVTVRQARNFDPGKHHVFPIPDKEIRKSKNLKQNKGY